MTEHIQNQIDLLHVEIRPSLFNFPHYRQGNARAFCEFRLCEIDFLSPFFDKSGQVIHYTYLHILSYKGNQLYAFKYNLKHF